MADGDRGSGRTTEQMKDAPVGATFIWCNDRTSYAERLAKHLGRPDLRIKPLSWYLWDDGINVRGMSPHMVVIDHAAEV